MGKRLYCPSCGEEVDAFVMLVKGEEVHHCPQCGAHLGSGQPAPAPPPLEVVLIAQDSSLLKAIVKEVLEEQGMARSVIPCKDGNDLVQKFSERLKDKSKVDLVILDLQMQVLSGTETARAVRQIEQSLAKTKKVPILFFSSVKVDDPIKKFLGEVQPAAYLFKKDDTSPLSIAGRMKDVLTKIYGVEKFTPTGQAPEGSRKGGPLKVHHITEGKVVTLMMQGDLTAQAEEAIQGAITASQAGFAVLIVDLSKVEYINSSGIAILIGLVKNGRAAGYTMAIAGLTEHYRKLFTMVGLAQYVQIFPSLFEARQQFKSQS